MGRGCTKLTSGQSRRLNTETVKVLTQVTRASVRLTRRVPTTMNTTLKIRCPSQGWQGSTQYSRSIQGAKPLDLFRKMEHPSNLWDYSVPKTASTGPRRAIRDGNMSSYTSLENIASKWV